VSDNSRIEWTDATWNPVTGCTKVSAGCAHCYAETFAERFRGVPGHPFEQGFDLKLWPERLNLPLTWKQPRKIFVNSMSDLFHKKVPDQFIRRVFQVMCSANQHVFQVLTKRPERMMEWVNAHFRGLRSGGVGKRLLPANVWLGTSVENQDCLQRVRCLQKTFARVRFLSFEPLLGKISLNESLLRGIHWVIVGGESGPGARPMSLKWVKDIHEQCRKSGVSFFFKQWGAFNKEGHRVGKKVAGRILDGAIWNEMPEMRKREALGAI
jgi:protein gp37